MENRVPDSVEAVDMFKAIKELHATFNKALEDLRQKLLASSGTKRQQLTVAYQKGTVIVDSLEQELASLSRENTQKASTPETDAK